MIISKKGSISISGSVSELMADLGVIVDVLHTEYLKHMAVKKPRR